MVLHVPTLAQRVLQVLNYNHLWGVRGTDTERRGWIGRGEDSCAWRRCLVFLHVSLVSAPRSLPARSMSENLPKTVPRLPRPVQHTASNALAMPALPNSSVLCR